MVVNQNTGQIFSFLSDDRFNIYQVCDLPDYMKQPMDHEKRNGRILPKRADGFALGNSKVFAAVSTRNYRNRIWTTSISQLYGPNYNCRIAREPYAYGGNYTSPMPFHDFILLIDGKTFRPDQTNINRSRRTLGAPIVNASMAVKGIKLETVDFCPVAPRLPAVVRAVRLKNIGSMPREIGVLVFFGFQHITSSLPDVELSRNEFTASFDQGFLLGCVEGTFWNAVSPGENGLVWENIYVRSERNLETEFVSRFDSMLRYSSFQRDNRADESMYPQMGTQEGKRIKKAKDLALQSSFGCLQQGEERVFTVFLINALSPSEAGEYREHLQEKSSFSLFQDTYSYWLQWSSSPKISSSYKKVDHLLDSIKVLIKVHEIENTGFATGMNFFGFRSWIRDNYYLGRALLKIGKHAEAYKNLKFFYEKWRRYGVCEHYPFSGKGRIDIWNLRTEGPALLALMLRDYYNYTGDDKTLSRCADMVFGSVNELVFSPRGLQTLCGSETYRFVTVTDPWAESADNTFSAVCALEFADQLLSAAGKSTDRATGRGTKYVEEYKEQALFSRKAIERFLVYEGRYAHYISHQGDVEEKIVANILARPIVVGYSDDLDPVARKGIEEVWNNNLSPGGLIKCDPNFYLLPGNTVGLVLYNAAELDVVWAKLCLDAALSLSSCTGTFYEFYDIYDNRITNERLRLWDSACVLEAIIHFLFGIKPLEKTSYGRGFEIAPHISDKSPEVSAEEYPLFNDTYSVYAAGDQMRIKKNSIEIFSSNRPFRAQIFDRTIILKPVGFFSPKIEGRPLLIEEANHGIHFEGGEYLGEIDIRFYLSGKRYRYVQAVQNGYLTKQLSTQDGEIIDRVELHNKDICLDTVILNENLQNAGTLEAGRKYCIKGRAYYSPSLIPFTGQIRYTSSDENQLVVTDMYGGFSIPLEIKSSSGAGSLTYFLETSGKKESATVGIAENTLCSLDSILGTRDNPAAWLVFEKKDSFAKSIVYEIWKQVFLANGIDLPVFSLNTKRCIRTELTGDRNIFAVLGAEEGNALQDTLHGWKSILKKKNISVFKKNREEIFAFLLILNRDKSVMQNCTAVMDILKNRTNCFRREYRPWRKNSFIPLYEYNAAMRDIRTLQETGTFPEEVQVEIDAPETIKCFLSGREARKGKLFFGERRNLCKKPAPPYVAVYEGRGTFVRTLAAFDCSQNIRKLVIEADSNADNPFKTSIKIILNQTTLFLEQPFSRYFDAGRENMHFYKERMGNNVLELSMIPGIILPKSKTEKNRTYRNVEIAVGGLKPSWM